MVSWINKKITELIKRDTGIAVDPQSFKGINRGFWYAYPEAYRWYCDEIGGDERRIYCNASKKLCLFLGGFEEELYHGDEEWELLPENKNKKTDEEIIRYKFNMDKLKRGSFVGWKRKI